MNRSSLVETFDLPSRNWSDTPHSLRCELIVTLTSYPGRFPILPYTLECLFKQSIKPDRIVLWLAENDKEEVPTYIQELAQPENKHGFEIRYCEDWKSYKKIIPSLIAFPDAVLVTADDDLFYDYDWLRNLVENWDGNPNKAVCRRAHGIRLGENNYPIRYKEWAYEISGPREAHNLFPTSGAGVLFPPQVLSREATNAELFTKLAGNCDDIWLFWMLMRAGSTVSKTRESKPLVDWPRNETAEPLWMINCEGGGNDKAISAMIQHFGWPKHIESYPS